MRKYKDYRKKCSKVKYNIINNHLKLILNI
jgi:hypothetical protein